MNQKLLYRVCEVAEFLSLSRSKTYELLRSGTIRCVRIDGSLRVRGVDVQTYVDSLTEAA
jgi:excisionase family DNA binding protein